MRPFKAEIPSQLRELSISRHICLIVTWSLLYFLPPMSNIDFRPLSLTDVTLLRTKNIDNRRYSLRALVPLARDWINHRPQATRLSNCGCGAQKRSEPYRLSAATSPDKVHHAANGTSLLIGQLGVDKQWTTWRWANYHAVTGAGWKRNLSFGFFLYDFSHFPG